MSSITGLRSAASRAAGACLVVALITSCSKSEAPEQLGPPVLDLQPFGTSLKEFEANLPPGFSLKPMKEEGHKVFAVTYPSGSMYADKDRYSIGVTFTSPHFSDERLWMVTMAVRTPWPWQCNFDQFGPAILREENNMKPHFEVTKRDGLANQRGAVAAGMSKDRLLEVTAECLSSGQTLGLTYQYYDLNLYHYKTDYARELLEQWRKAQ